MKRAGLIEIKRRVPGVAVELLVTGDIVPGAQFLRHRPEVERQPEFPCQPDERLVY